MPIAQLLELWKKIEVEPMEIETPEEDLNLDSEPTAEDTVGEATDKVDPPSLETKTAALAENLGTPPPETTGSEACPQAPCVRRFRESGAGKMAFSRWTAPCPAWLDVI
ncbi:hypothetical protein AB1E18_007513 [Capra hircus]